MPSGYADEAVAAAARLEPEALRRGLHDAFARLLVALGREGPFALVFEDVQWIDAASLDLLRDVAWQVGTVPLLLCLTTRPEGGEIAASIAARSVAGGAGRFDLDLTPCPLET